MTKSNLTREQKRQMKERIARVKVMRDKCKNELYPMVKDASKSIEDAKTFCGVVSNTMRQMFAQQMKTLKVKDLDLISKLDKKAPNYNDYLRLLNNLAEETITDALEMIEGFPQVIDNILRSEAMERKFEDLVIDWDKA